MLLVSRDETKVSYHHANKERHVFCTTCAAQWRLSDAPDYSQRYCPVCGTHLPGDYDITPNDANPSEDYKAKILAGMSPSIIMDCAEKALGFYNYQATQEMYPSRGLCLPEVNQTKGTIAVYNTRAAGKNGRPSRLHKALGI
jgi:hypothetical protein